MTIHKTPVQTFVELASWHENNLAKLRQFIYNANNDVEASAFKKVYQSIDNFPLKLAVINNCECDENLSD